MPDIPSTQRPQISNNQTWKFLRIGMMIEIATDYLSHVIKRCWVFLSVPVISTPVSWSYNWYLQIIPIIYSSHPHHEVRIPLNFSFPCFCQLSSGHFNWDQRWENLHRNLIIWLEWSHHHQRNVKISLNFRLSSALVTFTKSVGGRICIAIWLPFKRVNGIGTANWLVLHYSSRFPHLTNKRVATPTLGNLATEGKLIGSKVK